MYVKCVACFGEILGVWGHYLPTIGVQVVLFCLGLELTNQ